MLFKKNVTSGWFTVTSGHGDSNFSTQFFLALAIALRA